VSEISPEDLRSLVNENASLAEKLEASEDDRERLRSALTEVRAELDAVRDQLEEAKEAVPAVLPPAEVAKLVDRLLSDLDSQLSGLSVRDGELQLKIGVQKAGEQVGFVLPSAGSGSDTQENLHSISVRLGPEVN
jgi:predicted nuclease with TOPRIM domain